MIRLRARLVGSVEIAVTSPRPWPTATASGQSADGAMLGAPPSASHAAGKGIPIVGFVPQPPTAIKVPVAVPGIQTAETP